MPYNAVTETNFSEQQTAGSDVGNASVSSYTATGGEYTYQKDALIGSQPLLHFRDGIEWAIVDTDATFGSGREVKIDTDTGDVTYNDNLPALEANESSRTLYLPNGGEADITEPVTLQQGKDYIKVEGDDDDSLITSLISSARLICEQYCNKSLVERTITAVIRNELGGQRLPYGPHGEIVSCVDEDGEDVTVTTRGSKFLTITDPCSEYLEIVYTAGYSVCPPMFRTAILKQLAYMYQNRGNELVSTNIGTGAKEVLDPVRDIV